MVELRVTPLRGPRHLHRVLSRYLAGEKSLVDFYAWFVLATWDVHLAASERVRGVVSEITRLFDEYGHGGRSEARLKTGLRSLVTSTGFVTIREG